ncbi:MAG: oligopeptidase B, partial [Vicinamibacteria bacterium]
MPSRPPEAKRILERLEIHGHVRHDPYFWLNRRGDPEVLAYLRAENAYIEEAMAHTRELQETLFAEITARIDPEDSSVPYRRDGYYHYHRFEPGKDYALHCRRKETLEASEVILFDENELARGHEFFSLRFSDVSPDQKLA